MQVTVTQEYDEEISKPADMEAASHRSTSTERLKYDHVHVDKKYIDDVTEH